MGARVASAVVAELAAGVRRVARAFRFVSSKPPEARAYPHSRFEPHAEREQRRAVRDFLYRDIWRRLL